MLRLRRPVEIDVGGQSVTIDRRPLLMGIVNVTPDSFSDGGKFLDVEAAIAQGLALAGQGADWLDIGGESTRPGATPVPIDEELRRVIPVIEGLAAQLKIPLSIDTYKPAVAARAISAGASIINDVTGFREPDMVAAAADSGAACICMHMRGTPQNMAELAEYGDVVEELVEYFESRIETMQAGGVPVRRILIDPGIGFAKRRRHNLDIFSRLDAFHRLGRPVVLGASRKRIIGDLTGQPQSDRLYGTIGTAVIGYCHGVHVLRIHDVRPIAETLQILEAVDANESESDGQNGV